MELDAGRPANECDPRFKFFHEFMHRKVPEILWAPTLDKACITEEGGRFAEIIIHPYRGINLRYPPRLTRASSTEEVLRNLEKKAIRYGPCMQRPADMDVFAFGKRLEVKPPHFRVILLFHKASEFGAHPTVPPAGNDRTFVWAGNIVFILPHRRGRAVLQSPAPSGRGKGRNCPDSETFKHLGGIL